MIIFDLLEDFRFKQKMNLENIPKRDQEVLLKIYKEIRQEKYNNRVDIKTVI